MLRVVAGGDYAPNRAECERGDRKRDVFSFSPTNSELTADAGLQELIHWQLLAGHQSPGEGFDREVEAHGARAVEAQVFAEEFFDRCPGLQPNRCPKMPVVATFGQYADAQHD